MHNFYELVDRCANFSLGALREVNEKMVDFVQEGAETVFVKNMQMVSLHRVIFAVGMFSVFEASLQKHLQCRNGFREAECLLEGAGEYVIKEVFSDLVAAVNVLKHGQGRSYEMLISKAKDLPFRIKKPGENFYSEGDVSEVDVLVEVDDAFVQLCGEVIRQVSGVVLKV